MWVGGGSGISPVLELPSQSFAWLPSHPAGACSVQSVFVGRTTGSMPSPSNPVAVLRPTPAPAWGTLALLSGGISHRLVLLCLLLRLGPFALLSLARMLGPGEHIIGAHIIDTCALLGHCHIRRRMAKLHSVSHLL